MRIHVSRTFGQTPGGGGAAGSRGSHLVLRVSRNLHSVFHSGRANLHVHQQRTRGPEISPHVYGQTGTGAWAKSAQRRGGSLFSERCWEHWAATCRRMKPDFRLTPNTRINSKWVRDPNMRPGTITPQKKTQVLNSRTSVLGLYDFEPKGKGSKAKRTEWDPIKLKAPALQVGSRGCN